MTELQPLLDLAVKQWPWLLKLATFIGFARLAMKPGAIWLKSAITWSYERVITTSTTIDDHWLERLVETPFYGWFAFLVDFLCSVKLPLKEDLFKPSTPPAP